LPNLAVSFLALSYLMINGLASVNTVFDNGSLGLHFPEARAVQKGGIQFINDNETTSTRYNHHVPIVEGNYSIVLSGGYSYTVLISIGGLTTYLYAFSLYVPANVTTLTANFPP
jgi:hypothetical protein